MKTTVTLLSLLTVLSLAIPQTLHAQSGAGSPVATIDSTDPGVPDPSGDTNPAGGTSDGYNRMNADRLMQIVPGLTQSEAVTLAQTGAVTADYSGAISARIAPPFEGKDAMLKELNKTEATVGIELLFQAPIPRAYRDRKDFWLETYNIMRSISTLKGIKYYSADRNIMRTFYYDAYAVPSPEQQKTRLPDPVVASIPASSHIYTYHKDSSFGNYVMSINYTAGPDPQNPQYARMAMSNATTMYYSIIPIEQPYKLQIDLVVVPVGDTMLFYGNFVANTLTLFGLRDSVDVSFTNRVKALYNWFMDEIRLNTP